MFDLVKFIDFCKYLLIVKLNTFRTSCDSSNNRPGKLWNTTKTPVWNIPQVNRIIGDR